MHNILKQFITSDRLFRGWLPVLTAAILVVIGPLLADIPLIAENAAVLAALIALCFIFPILREFLFLVVIFSIAFYSGRHGIDGLILASDSGWNVKPSEWVTIIQWHLIALFAFIAGLGESRLPPSSWGRRFYFLAIAVYFLGLAMVASISQEWVKMMALGCLGAISIYGAVALPMVNLRGPNKEDDEEEEQSEEEPLVERRATIKVRRY